MSFHSDGNSRGGTFCRLSSLEDKNEQLQKEETHVLQVTLLIIISDLWYFSTALVTFVNSLMTEKGIWLCTANCHVNRGSREDTPSIIRYSLVMLVIHRCLFSLL